MDTTKMTTVRKCVRPLSVQGDFESRKLWQNVTNALKSNDIDTATQHKRFVSTMYLGFSTFVIIKKYWYVLPCQINITGPP